MNPSFKRLACRIAGHKHRNIASSLQVKEVGSTRWLQVGKATYKECDRCGRIPCVTVIFKSRIGRGRYLRALADELKSGAELGELERRILEGAW